MTDHDWSWHARAHTHTLALPLKIQEQSASFFRFYLFFIQKRSHVTPSLLWKIRFFFLRDKELHFVCVCVCIIFFPPPSDPIINFSAYKRRMKTRGLAMVDVHTGHTRSFFLSFLIWLVYFFYSSVEIPVFYISHVCRCLYTVCSDTTESFWMCEHGSGWIRSSDLQPPARRLYTTYEAVRATRFIKFDIFHGTVWYGSWSRI